MLDALDIRHGFRDLNSNKIIMKKRYLIFTITLLFLASTSFSQMSILFVDDSDDTFGNADVFYNAISSVGYDADYYDAVAEEASPDDVMLSEYDLVIWYTSSDGTDLYLWNGVEEDNESIEIYLEDGGMLWLVGLDFLYDKYGEAPYEMSEGEFTFDYLGIANYEAQSYADDSGVGLPMAEVSPDSPLPYLLNLSWQFETMWYADAVAPREDVSAVYVMGDEDYLFAGKPCALYNETDIYKVLSYYFDISLISPSALINANVYEVLTYFNSFVIGVEESNFASNLSIYPNPGSGEFTLDLGLIKNQPMSIDVIDLQGRVVQHVLNGTIQQERIALTLGNDVPAGLYLVRIQQGNDVITKALSLLH